MTEDRIPEPQIGDPVAIRVRLDTAIRALEAALNLALTRHPPIAGRVTDAIVSAQAARALCSKLMEDRIPDRIPDDHLR